MDFSKGMFGSEANTYAQTGRNLANIVGSLFGVKVPEFESKRILGEIDYNNPASLQTAAQELARMGMMDQAMSLAQQARSISKEERQYNLDLAKYNKSLLKDATEEERKQTEFYSKNPEQATFRLEELAKTLATNPSDPVALKEYEQITAAASTGAMDRFEKEQKAAREATAADVDLEKARTLTQKYKKDLEDAAKFGPGARWQAEKQAALNLLKNYSIDPNKPLEGQVKPGFLYSPAGAEITNAYERALRPDVGGSGAIDFNNLPK